MATARRNRAAAKFTPEIQAKILDDVRKGLPQKYAAQRANVGERTLQHWLTRGRRAGKSKADAPYVAFLAAFKKAEADGVAADVELIRWAGELRDEITIKTKMEYDPVTGKPRVVETHTTTKKVMEWQAIAWLLERTHPEYFSTNRARLRKVEKESAQQAAKIKELEAIIESLRQSLTGSTANGKATGATGETGDSSGATKADQ
jgi:transposase